MRDHNAGDSSDQPAHNLLRFLGKSSSEHRDDREVGYLQESGGILLSVIFCILFALLIFVFYSVCKKCNWKFGSQQQMVHKVQSIEMAEGTLVQVETNSRPHSYIGTYEGLANPADPHKLTGLSSSISHVHVSQSSKSKAKGNAVKPYSLEDAFEDNRKSPRVDLDRDVDMTGSGTQGNGDQWTKIPPPSLNGVHSTVTVAPKSEFLDRDLEKSGSRVGISNVTKAVSDAPEFSQSQRQMPQLTAAFDNYRERIVDSPAKVKDQNSSLNNTSKQQEENSLDSIANL